MLLNDNSRWRWSHWLLALLAPLLATLVCWFLADYLPAASLALFYLAAVLLTAVSTAIRPALLSAVLSFLSYNFFFTAPHFTLFILHREDILTASLLILVAILAFLGVALVRFEFSRYLTFDGRTLITRHRIFL